ncbi:hypothetical protein INT43_003190 [Umbelopsis isabellina]|uniref:Cytochrome P450 n=1 Tax=Mortierella isabellina TaxID=91625 RepID=A0A8H7PQA3_MORIS|nr:hypothetical protein INT43_003190 [Umbelopsis isabellina]
MMAQEYHIVTSLLQMVPRTLADAFLLRKVGIATGLTILIGHCWFTMWLVRRYLGPMRTAPIAHTSNFWISKLGTAPPPNDKETKDELSAFLIQCGQDPSQLPWCVCWSFLGTPLVILNSLQSIKDVLIDAQLKKSRNGKPAAQRGRLINKIQNIVFGGKNINNTVGEEWRWRRLVMGRPFSKQKLTTNHLPFAIKRVKELTSTIQQAADTRQTLELDDVFMDLTMDVINQYLYGRSAEHELDYSIVGGKTNLKHEHHLLGLGFMSPLIWLPFGIGQSAWAQQAFAPARYRIKRFINDSIDRALEDAKACNDTKFHSLAAEVASKYNDDRVDLLNDFLTITFAGHDTTAHTLAFAFSEIARNPQIQEKIYEETCAVFGPVMDDSTITSEKLSQLSYIRAVYQETMRLYPAVVFIPVHANDNIMADGQIISAGSEMWCNVRGLQMNSEIFPEPEKFKPERWLEIEVGSQNTRLHNFPNLSFTLGPHSCLGKSLALLELRLAIAHIVHHFTCSLKADHIIDTKVELTTKPRYGVPVNFQRRCYHMIQ